MKHFALALAATLALAAVPAHAQRVYVVRPLDGYACARLNATDAQMLNPNGTGINILVEPRPDAPVGTTASAILFVRQPAQPVNGFLAVMQINGRPGWINVRHVRSYDPNTRCTPSVMSNGRIGAG